MGRKASKGRQKIKMVKMENESNLQVTFSKRRSGLFKKASELCTLCGAEVAIIVFSPGQKVYSFGHPSVESVIDNRFLKGNYPPLHDGGMHQQHCIKARRIDELNVQLTQLQNMLEAEKERGEAIDQMRKASKNQHCWWEGPIDDLNFEQLQQLKGGMEDLRKDVNNQVHKSMMEAVPQFPFPQLANVPFDDASRGSGHGVPFGAAMVPFHDASRATAGGGVPVYARGTGPNGNGDAPFYATSAGASTSIMSQSHGHDSGFF